MTNNTFDRTVSFPMQRVIFIEFSFVSLFFIFQIWKKRIF